MRISKYHLSILGALLFGIFLTVELNAQEINKTQRRSSPEFRYEQAPSAQRQHLIRKSKFTKNRRAHQTCAVAPRTIKQKSVRTHRRTGPNRSYKAVQQRKIERAFKRGAINKRQYKKSMKRLHKQHPHNAKKHHKLKKKQH